MLVLGKNIYITCCIYRLVTVLFCFIADIDECEIWKARGGRLCSGVCENTIGSYICTCPPGYRILTDGKTCQGNIDPKKIHVVNLVDVVCWNTEQVDRLRRCSSCNNGSVHRKSLMI